MEDRQGVRFLRAVSDNLLKHATLVTILRLQ